ncbi:hypothetical protein LTR08_009115 [Meristemomyces frigidus]|nr:hypothetical protein LTR08_009115 [Meristemomyces frigidus]
MPPRACKKRNAEAEAEAEDVEATTPKKKLKTSPMHRGNVKEPILPNPKVAVAKRESQAAGSGTAPPEKQFKTSPVDFWNVEEGSSATEKRQEPDWQGYMKDERGKKCAVPRVTVNFDKIYWKRRKQEATNDAESDEPVSPKTMPSFEQVNLVE